MVTNPMHEKISMQEKNTCYDGSLDRAQERLVVQEEIPTQERNPMQDGDGMGSKRQLFGEGSRQFYVDQPLANVSSMSEGEEDKLDFGHLQKEADSLSEQEDP